MIFLWIQTIGLLLLVYFASRLFLQKLGYLFFSVLKSQSAVIKAIAFFLLPGTFLHEAAHLVFAEFLQVRTDGLTVVPEVKEDRTIKLGGVKIEQTGPLRRTIIGLAPVFFGLIIIWVATAWLEIILAGHWVLLVFYLFLLLQVGLTMFSSPKDLEGSVIGITLAGLLFLLIKYLGEIIVFAPLVRAKTLFISFIENHLFYLRNGLFYSLLIIIAVLILVTLFNRLLKRR